MGRSVRLLGGAVLLGMLWTGTAAAVAPAATSDDTAAMMPLSDDAKAADSLYRAAIVLYERQVCRRRAFSSSGPPRSAEGKRAALQRRQGLRQSRDRKAAIEWYRKVLGQQSHQARRGDCYGQAAGDRARTGRALRRRSPPPPSLPFVEQITKHTFQTL